jgi:hypothetical protein
MIRTSKLKLATAIFSHTEGTSDRLGRQGPPPAGGGGFERQKKSFFFKSRKGPNPAAGGGGGGACLQPSSNLSVYLFRFNLFLNGVSKHVSEYRSDQPCAATPKLSFSAALPSYLVEMGTLFLR